MLYITATGGTSHNATKSEVTKPDGDTGSSGSDKPDCGVYIPVNVYVLNWDNVPDVFFLYLIVQVVAIPAAIGR